MIVFGDLETTGNDTATAQILEVGLLVTDDDLRICRGASEVVRPITPLLLDDYILTLDPVVQRMHARTGLWEEVRNHGVRRHEAEARLVEWLERSREGVSGYPMQFTLAGNSVWFDLVIMRREMPQLAAMFDRRIIDVSSVNQLAKRWAHKAYEDRPRADSGHLHRAYDDACESRDVLKHYRDKGLFVDGSGEAGDAL